MPIKREGKFYISHDLAHVTCLGIESSQIDLCIKRVNKNGIKGVFGFPGFGFDEINLDFLKEIPWVEAIWFWDIKLKDIEGIYSLKNLISFGVHPKRPPVDFSSFSRLKKLVIEPKAKDSGIKSLNNLDLLHIWRYRSKSKDFCGFEFPENITELEINWSNIESLESLPSLRKLKHLEIHRCRNLEKLTDLGKKFPQLEHFVVDTCGKVKHNEGVNAISGCKKLKHVYVQRKKL
jgi:hypothetical protein